MGYAPYVGILPRAPTINSTANCGTKIRERNGRFTCFTKTSFNRGKTLHPDYFIVHVEIFI
jgi:hypothetical protein